jgi:hypothetical protein
LSACVGGHAEVSGACCAGEVGDWNGGRDRAGGAAVDG